MTTMQITAHIPQEEGVKIDEEAQALGTSRTDYIKQLVLQRHGKTVQIANADAEKIQARMEGKIEILSDQNAQLQRDLASANEGKGLNGIEVDKKSTKRQIDEALEAYKAESELKGLREKVEQLQTDLDVAEDERDDYKAKADDNARTAMWIEKGGQALEVVGRIAPKPVEKIMNGLAGLLGSGEGSGLNGTDLSDEDQIALNAGRTVMQAIGEEHRTAVIELIQWMAAAPNVIGQIRNGKGFQKWYSQQQTPA